MTKMKSKKMTKSTFAIIIMAIVMVAMLAFGGTYAYFTATTTANDEEVQTGTVMLSNSGLTVVAEGVKFVPGMKLTDGTITIGNSSDVETWIFVTVTTAATDSEGNEIQDSVYTAAGITEATLVSVDLTGSEFKDSTTYTGLAAGVYALKADAYSAEADNGSYDFVKSITLNSAIKSNTVDSTAGPLQGITITVTVTAESIQTFKGYDAQGTAEYFSAADAYAALHPVQG